METCGKEDLAKLRAYGRAVEKALSEQNNFLIELREKYDAPANWGPDKDGQWCPPVSR